METRNSESELNLTGLVGQESGRVWVGENGDFFVEATGGLNKIGAPELYRMPPDGLADHFFDAVGVAS